MQNQTVVQLPLESYRAIKKQFEVEIDVPWGLLPGTRCVSGRGQLTDVPWSCFVCARRCCRTSLGSAQGKYSLRHPTASGCTHHCAQGSLHLATRAPQFFLCVFYSFYFFPPGIVPRYGFLDAKSQGIKSQVYHRYRQTVMINTSCFQQVPPHTHKTRSSLQQRNGLIKHADFSQESSIVFRKVMLF